MLADAAETLAAWEAASAVPPAARIAVLVHRAELAKDLDAALDMPLGEAAAMAARVHSAAFGDFVDGILHCEGCGEELDVTVPLAELSSNGGATTAEAAGFVVRAPTVRDLVAAGETEDPSRALMTTCVRDAAHEPVDPGELDAEQIAELDAAAESLAGAAGLVLRSRCPTCGEDATSPLDIGALLWEQVERSAHALLTEVAELGAAFGWSEADVLALSPLRRRAYLELARDGG
jgi:hypothetical protein